MLKARDPIAKGQGAQWGEGKRKDPRWEECSNMRQADGKAVPLRRLKRSRAQIRGRLTFSFATPPQWSVTRTAAVAIGFGGFNGK